MKEDANFSLILNLSRWSSERKMNFHLSMLVGMFLNILSFLIIQMAHDAMIMISIEKGCCRLPLKSGIASMMVRFLCLLGIGCPKRQKQKDKSKTGVAEFLLADSLE